VVRNHETSRRIEPAATQPGPPHQNVPAAARVNSAARTETRRAATEDDNFGAGID
jgi:hypothetical protein